MTYDEIDRSWLQSVLTADEGCRSTPYKCPAGATTIGIGHNLDQHGLCPAAIEAQFQHDLSVAIADARVFMDGFDGHPLPAVLAIILMAFQLGATRLGGFLKMCDAIRARQYDRAKREAEDSLWAKQTPRRFERVARLLDEAIRSE